MLLRPPRSTRTDTLFPYTSLFRSLLLCIVERGFRLQPVGEAADFLETALQPAEGWRRLAVADFLRQPVEQVGAFDDAIADRRHRSGERRVGKECVRPCRSRWSPSH